MGFVNGAWIILLGVLGAANLIIARKPSAKELIAKIAPYQGWIGAVSAIYGIYEIIWCVLNLSWLTTWPISWVTYLVAGVLQLTLGLLLGVGVLKTFIKQPLAVEKMNHAVTRLMPYQGTLGLIAIGMGFWAIVPTILHI